MKGRRWTKRLGRWVLGIALVLAGVVMLAPIAWIFVNSIEPTSQQFSIPPVWVPSHPTLAAYRYLFHIIPYGVELLNTVGVSLAVVLGSTIVAILAAYAFARLRFPGRELIFGVLLVSLMVPVQVASVPEFLVVKHLGMFNTRTSLVIPALIQVFAIFLLRQHFLTIPREMEEAATLDGAGRWQVLRVVIVPMSWPAISAVAVITGQYIWNDFFWPNLFISSQNRMTAALGLLFLQDQYTSSPVAPIFAGISLLAVPAVIIFILLQRKLTAALSFAGIRK